MLIQVHYPENLVFPEYFNDIFGLAEWWTHLQEFSAALDEPPVFPSVSHSFGELQ